MEIEIALTTDNTFFSRLARWLGAEWTHAMLRFPIYKRIRHCESITLPQDSVIEGAIFNILDDSFRIEIYHIIEAGFRHGVVERAWNPEEYSKWAVYRLTDKAIKARLGYLRHPEDIYDDMLAYARGNIGKRYAYEKLALLLPRLIREGASRRIARFDSELFCYTILGTGQVCTSLVDDCFLQGGHMDLVPHLDTPWVFPDDIRDSPLLEKVEER